MENCEHGRPQSQYLLEPSNKTPSHGKEHIRNIIRFPNNRKPSINHDVIARVSLNGLGILNSLPWDLGECISFDELALLLVAEGILLAICTVPHPVEEEIQNRESGEGESVPAIFGGVVIGEVECTMAISEWYTGHIPKSEQESQLFEIHIPVCS